MNQLQWLTLTYKIILITGSLSLFSWIAIYTAEAKWWLNIIGRALVVESALVIGLLLPTTLSLFLTINPFLLAWINAGFIALITPVMIQRSFVWVKVYRGERRDQVAGEPGNPKRTEETSEWGNGDREPEVRPS